VIDRVRLLLCVAAVGLTMACRAEAPSLEKGGTDARAEVSAAMERYMVAARAVDAEAMAACFAPQGVLFEPGIEPIETRDAIRRFLGSFPGARVEVATVEPQAIEIFGATALYWGKYHERLAFPGQPASDQRGRFVIEWSRQSDGTWLIQRYFRVPVTTINAP